jgi:hypothetical protein
MTRIRYKQNNNNELVSAPILVGQRNLEIVLGNNHTFTIRVFDAVDDVILTKECKDDFSMKLAARRAIMDLGANLLEEKRPRKVNVEDQTQAAI